MPYTATINEQQPGCLVFLVDQSPSMITGAMDSPGGVIAKGQAVCDVINRSIAELVDRAARSDGVRNWFDIGVFGYGPIQSLFGGPLTGRTLVPLGELAHNPLDIRRNERMRYPVWVQPQKGGTLPTCSALRHCHEIIEDWTMLHPRSFPPVVWHYTQDGANDGDPRDAARELMSLKTDDGNLLLLNCYVAASARECVAYPDESTELPNGFARQLFDMSSELPEAIVARARSAGLSVRTGSRGLVFNAGFESLKSPVDLFLRMLNVGTCVLTNLPQHLR